MSANNNLCRSGFCNAAFKNKAKVFANPAKILINLLLYMLLGTGLANAQQMVSGNVTAIDGTPLYPASIVLKNTGVATTTDEAGSFTIFAKKADVLIISFIEFNSKEITINNETIIHIALERSIINLDAVVVTGYSSQKIKEITGSVAIVKPRDLTAVPAGQVEQMLQGRVAGLNVITSGQPGATSNIRLHGIGNFGDVTPLYIIDGVQGNINNLNPNDVESIQVLKDAGAYSIYGVRGSNGVIVITTRNGKPGKTKVSYDFYMKATKPGDFKTDLVTPQEHAELSGIASKNSGYPAVGLYGYSTNPILPDFFIAGFNQGLLTNDPEADPALYNIDGSNGNFIYQIIEANKTGTDWFHEVFKSAFSHNHSLSVSGGNEKNKYFFSFGYLNDQGTVINTHLKKFNIRINTQFTANEKIRVGENLQLTHRDNPLVGPESDSPNDNDIFRSLVTLPILPVYDIKGNWAHFVFGNFFDNPVALRTVAKDDIRRSWDIAGNAFAEVDFLKHLTVRTSFGGNFVSYYFNKYFFYNYNILPTGLPDNTLTESSGYRRSWTWTNTLKFSQKFGEHRLNVLAGVEAIDNYNRELGGKKIGFFTNDPNYRFLTNGNAVYGQSNYSFAGLSTLYSFISRADYNFKDKYFFTATLRRDGSSVFTADKRFGWFPSLSAAWRITEEDYSKDSKWLEDFKLRASWGKTGYYGNTDPFNQFTLYGGSIGDAYYDINGTNSPAQGFRAVRIGDPNTGWQEDVVTNIGFEAICFDNELNLTLDWYNKKAKGLLIPVTLPDVIGGATRPNINVGTIKNTGIDILIGSKGKLSTHLKWDAALTFTTYNNKVLKLTDVPYFIPPFNVSGPFVRNEVGRPVSSFYGYKIIGLFRDSADVNKAPLQNEAAPGRFRFLDANNDNKISAEDRVHIGDPNPDFTLGINIGLTFRHIDFSTFWYGSFGNEVVNVPKLSTDFYQYDPLVAKSKALLYDSWTPQNTDAKIPIIENAINFSNVAEITSYLVEKGTYFRNKSIILGYSFPKSMLDKLKMEKVRIYVQAVNLFTITNYSGLDPELPGYSAGFGIDFGNYPNNQKQFLFGLNVNF